MTKALCEYVVGTRIARFAMIIFRAWREKHPLGLQRGNFKGAQTAVGTSKLSFVLHREGNTPVPQLMSPEPSSILQPYVSICRCPSRNFVRRPRESAREARVVLCIYALKGCEGSVFQGGQSAVNTG